jgi:outer membrane immunogenic protein
MKSVSLKCVTLASLASCAFAAAVGSATAADMPVKARPLPPSPSCYDWSGAYGGGHYGYLWGDSHWTYANAGFATPAGTIETTSARQPFWGGHGGFLWQWGCRQGGNFVLGLEASISKLRENHTTGISNRFSPPQTAVQFLPHDSIDWMNTVGVRVGWAWDTYLFTVNGGWARASVTSRIVNSVDPANYFIRSTEAHNGWHFGATLEKMVYSFGAVDAILGAEYQYLRLNSARHCANFSSAESCGGFIPPSTPTAGLPRDVRDINLDAHTIRARLTLKWNPWTAPISAGY